MAPKYFYSCGHRLRHCVTNERRKKERLNERDKKREGREKETNKKKQTIVEREVPSTERQAQISPFQKL